MMDQKLCQKFINKAAILAGEFILMIFQTYVHSEKTYVDLYLKFRHRSRT
jgi:hypothetical protein